MILLYVCKYMYYFNNLVSNNDNTDFNYEKLTIYLNNE